MRISGKEIKDPKQLQLVVAETPVGQKVDVEIFRDGKPMRLALTIASSDAPSAQSPRSTESRSSWHGMSVAELPRSLRQSGIKGVIVTDVDPESAVAESIQQGDIIMSINKKQIASLKEFHGLITDAGKGTSVLLFIKRGDTNIYVVLRLR
jgi:S1-C subfamily serine protease